MVQFLKTTVMLPEDKIQQAKIKAVHERTTLSEILARGLDKELAAPAGAAYGYKPKNENWEMIWYGVRLSRSFKGKNEQKSAADMILGDRAAR